MPVATLCTVSDPRDKILSLLYAFKLPSLLTNNFLQSCAQCGKIYSAHHIADLSCFRSHGQIDNSSGTLTFHHVPLKAWTLHSYIARLRKSSESWMRIYWKIWSILNITTCLGCDAIFSTDSPATCLNINGQKPLPFAPWSIHQPIGVHKFQLATEVENLREYAQRVGAPADLETGHGVYDTQVVSTLDRLPISGFKFGRWADKATFALRHQNVLAPPEQQPRSILPGPSKDRTRKTNKDFVDKYGRIPRYLWREVDRSLAESMACPPPA